MNLVKKPNVEHSKSCSAASARAAERPETRVQREQRRSGAPPGAGRRAPRLRKLAKPQCMTMRVQLGATQCQCVSVSPGAVVHTQSPTTHVTSSEARQSGTAQCRPGTQSHSPDPSAQMPEPTGSHLPLSPYLRFFLNSVSKFKYVVSNHRQRHHTVGRARARDRRERGQVTHTSQARKDRAAV